MRRNSRVDRRFEHAIQPQRRGWRWQKRGAFLIFSFVHKKIVIGVRAGGTGVGAVDDTLCARRCGQRVDGSKQTEIDENSTNSRQRQEGLWPEVKVTLWVMMAPTTIPGRGKTRTEGEGHTTVGRNRQCGCALIIYLSESIYYTIQLSHGLHPTPF